MERSSGFLENWLFTSPFVSEDERTRGYRTRLLVVITFVTALLMWTYAFVAMVFVAESILTRIGFICSSMHLLSPWVYKRTRSMTLAAYNMVTAGIVFQFSFSFFTGGFFSPTLIWLAVLPMIVGILTNKVHAIVWTLISCSGVVLMYGLQHAGLVPADVLPELGRIVVQFLIALGLISLVGGFTLFFIELSHFFYNSKAKAKSHLDP